jgi:hypothetical protein
MYQNDTVMDPFMGSGTTIFVTPKKYSGLELPKVKAA